MWQCGMQYCQQGKFTQASMSRFFTGASLHRHEWSTDCPRGLTLSSGQLISAGVRPAPILNKTHFHQVWCRLPPRNQKQNPDTSLNKTKIFTTHMLMCVYLHMSINILACRYMYFFIHKLLSRCTFFIELSLINTHFIQSQVFNNYMKCH